MSDNSSINKRMMTNIMWADHWSVDRPYNQIFYSYGYKTCPIYCTAVSDWFCYKYYLWYRGGDDVDCHSDYHHCCGDYGCLSCGRTLRYCYRCCGDAFQYRNATFH